MSQLAIYLINQLVNSYASINQVVFLIGYESKNSSSEFEIQVSSEIQHGISRLFSVDSSALDTSQLEIKLSDFVRDEVGDHGLHGCIEVSKAILHEL